MKKLILVRHAKSSWKESVEDKARSLTNRGIRDAHLVSSEILKYLPKTFVIWCSSAKRAMETSMIFTQSMSFPAESIIFKDELYTFDVDQLEKVVKSCNNDCDCLILFGHNAAITDFVNKFGDVFIENVPTSGLVSIDIDVNSWKDIKKGKTRKTLFPKDLK